MNNREQSDYNAQEASRKATNMIREGVIVEARYDSKGAPGDNEAEWYTNEDANGLFRGPLYRVKIGDHKPYWMPQIHLRAHNDYEYWAFEVGERVVVLAPEGNPKFSFVLGALVTDENRPPIGFDDQSPDKRPWRESVHRIRYKDDYLVEYDRYLHRHLRVFHDGTKFEYWFLDDREDRTPREKETNSDKTGVPPRHWQHKLYADKLDHEILWDEDTKIHRRHYKWPDNAVFEYEWDEKNQTHYHHWIMADGSDYQYWYDEKVPLHHQKWAWPDGFIDEYEWNEAETTHLRKTTFADGSVKKYFYRESPEYHLDEIIYSSGTIMRYHHYSPHKHEILYADGSYWVYDFDTQSVNMHVNKNANATIGNNAIINVGNTAKITAGSAIQLHAPSILLDGFVTVTKGLRSYENITSDKSIVDTSGNTNHHSH